MNTKSYNIVSTHAKLSEAVAAAGIDLSYNEPLARSDLARADKDGKHKEAFVVEVDGKTKVFYAYETGIPADKGLVLLNEYSPFSACMDNTPFHIVTIEGDAFTVNPFDFPRTQRARAILGQFIKDAAKGKTATKAFASTSL